MPLADGDVYFDLIKATLSEAARKAFEMLPATYEYQDESLHRSYHRGEARGEAKSILAFLDARGIAVSETEKDAILECTDRELLERMVRKAATVQSAAELFE